MRALHTTSLFTKTKLTFLTGLAVAIFGLFAVSTVAVQKVSAADCDSNAIIYCGFSSTSDFINKVRANDSGNGHHDLQSVYAHQFFSGQNLTSSMYSDFAAHAVSGTAYRNGTIKLSNGQTVATGTSSIGREASFQGSNPKSYPVGSTTYFGNTNDKAFASDGLPVYVLFDSTGTMQFAVLKSCGNPVFGPPVKTSASCNSLQKTAVAGQLNTYDFTASANTAGNASVSKLVYNFGDGSAARVVTSNFGQAVRHQYTKAGTFTATVTVFADLPGHPNTQLPAVSMCAKTITVVLPVFNCVALTPTELDKSKFTFRFVVTARASGGATFVSTTYTLGDGVTKVVKANGLTTTLDYTYANPGNYNVSARLFFLVNGKTVPAPHECTASVSPTAPPVSTCKPGIPVGDKRCEVCKFDSSLPVDSPECIAPQGELPNTGAGNTIAIFAAVVIGGFLIYRQLLFRRHKAAFLAAQQGTSPLPLGDALNDAAPLRDTPLEPKRKSFRRNRPF
jgi:hypothetical protein